MNRLRPLNRYSDSERLVILGRAVWPAVWVRWLGESFPLVRSVKFPTHDLLVSRLRIIGAMRLVFIAPAMTTSPLHWRPECESHCTLVLTFLHVLAVCTWESVTSGRSFLQRILPLFTKRFIDQEKREAVRVWVVAELRCHAPPVTALHSPSVMPDRLQCCSCFVQGLGAALWGPAAEGRGGDCDVRIDILQLPCRRRCGGRRCPTHQ